MFTGIVAAVGDITEIKPLDRVTDAGVRLTISAGSLPIEDVALGDSIAINGACMTVVSKSENTFAVDVSRESLNRTCGLERIGKVNLEKALALADRIGGHLVSGHVDAKGKVVRFRQIAESWELVVAAPRALAKYIVFKGSIVVNGVSLTINTVHDFSDACHFSINLIPHTIEVTTLKYLSEGDDVNLEIDMIARYVERMLSSGGMIREAAGSKPGQDNG
jgi:riboflavin synthase